MAHPRDSEGIFHLAMPSHCRGPVSSESNCWGSSTGRCRGDVRGGALLLSSTQCQGMPLACGACFQLCIQLHLPAPQPQQLQRQVTRRTRPLKVTVSPPVPDSALPPLLPLHALFSLSREQTQHSGPAHQNSWCLETPWPILSCHWVPLQGG